MSGWSWRRRLKVFLPAAVGLIAVAVWFLYPRPTDRELIVDLIRRGEHGIETKNVKEVMSCVAPDYADSQNVTRTELLRMVMQWPRVREKGELTIENYDLEITPPTAKGTFDVTFVLIGQGGTREALPMTLTMQFVEQRKGWSRAWLVQSVEGYSMGSMIEGVGDE
jgi:hypothetical protein